MRLPQGKIIALALSIAAIGVAFGGRNISALKDLAEGTHGPAGSATESAVTPAAADDQDTADSLSRNVTMDANDARGALESMRIDKPHSMKGYQRAQFPHWKPAGDNGWTNLPRARDCDAREAALTRDGTAVVNDKGTCRVTQGTWSDPYTGSRVATAEELDIDHVVPLAAAWRSGADQWAIEERERYANAPVVVTTTAAVVNRAKGDKGPEVWKPANRGAWCAYAIRWVEIKHEYHLVLTSEAERAALNDMLGTCPTR